MSSLVRRTLRTTAAAVGIAALGAGLAGTAVAAPAGDAEAPAPETASESASTPQELSSLVPPAGLPGTSTVPDLPLPFAFQSPAVRTAAPSGTPALGAEQIPGAAALPQEVPLPDPGSATSRTEIGTDPSTLTEVGALSALDSARLFDGVQQVAPTGRQEPGTGDATEAG